MLYAALVCLVLAVVTSIMLYSNLSGGWGPGLLFPLFFALYAVAFVLGLRRAERRNGREDGRE